MKHAWPKPLAQAAIGATALAVSLLADAQPARQNTSDQRWYQIEVTVFAHENSMQAQEYWPMDMLQQPLPAATRPLDRLSDVLSLPQWRAEPLPISNTAPTGTTITAGDFLAELPEPAVPLRNSDFRLPDSERDAFLALPASAHGFSDTNRALAGSSRYRLLYHDAWRQPLTSAAQAVPIWISGGQPYGDRHEMEGTLTLRFNPGQDRVVIDARLWLTQFATMPLSAADEIRLPALPRTVAAAPVLQADSGAAVTGPAVTPEWHATQVIPVVSSREMRSNEFHYLDHPVIGIVVHVFPYTVPALPENQDALL